MTRRSRLGTLIGSVILGTTLFAQGFAVRTGTWSFTMTIKSDMPIEGLSPEARAEIEAQLRRPNTFTSCVTQEQLKNLNLGKPDDGDEEACETVSATISGTVADITRRCTGDEPTTETSHFEAPSPTALKATVTKKSATGTATIEMTGKWLSAKCTQ